jgi:hypothetical protein
MLWYLRWTTFGLLIWGLSLVWLSSSALADPVAIALAPAQCMEANSTDVESILEDARPSLIRTLSIVVGVLAFGIASLIWLHRDAERLCRSGVELLTLTRMNPARIERVELHDGELVHLRILLFNRPLQGVMGPSPVDCVRIFDELKAIAPSNAVFAVINAQARRTAESTWRAAQHKRPIG